MKRKKGKVTSQVRKIIDSPANHRVAIDDPVAQMSKMAIGIENKPTNHEYHGRMPSSINPKDMIEYKPLVENIVLSAYYKV